MSKEKDTLKSSKDFNGILKSIASYTPKAKKDKNKSSPPKKDK